MITHSEAVTIKKQLEPEYQARHDALRRLRDLWHGRWWENTNDTTTISSIFRDITSRSSDVGPDLKLVHNVLQEICVKYQTYLAPLPMIRVYADSHTSRGRKAQTMKERYLYGVWSENRMSRVLAEHHAWYLPLMGSSFHGIFPDFERNMPRVIVRSPEYAYPIPSAEMGEEGVIFSWKITESQARRAWPSFTPRSDTAGRVRKAYNKLRPQTDPKVEVLEYSDNTDYARWVDEQKVSGVEHNFGFGLFEHMKFIAVPGEQMGHGAVEQMVNMNEAGNVLMSLLMQAVIDNVFPTLVLTDPMKAPEEIMRGPGSVIPLNAGGSAEYLTPPVQGLGIQSQWMTQNERMMKDAAGVNEANFGRFDASIITGKAINELQGAGTGGQVEMVQGTGIGTALVSWNEKAIYMAQTMFKDDTIQLFGMQPRSGVDVAPQSFGLSLKGSELKGSQRNEVVFSPYIGQHEKVVMGLQMAGAGLVSKEWQREQAGIPDSEAMSEEIVKEVIKDAVIQAIVQGMVQAGADTTSAISAEDQAFALLQGSTGGAGQPGPLPPAGLGAGPSGGSLPPGMPPAMPGMPTGGGAPPPGLPPGAPAGMPPGMPPEAQAGGEDMIELGQAIEAFQAVQGVEGRVFLIGEIVEQGTTDEELEVAITQGSDRQVLSDSLSEYQGRLMFRSVEDEPDEKHVEVTPGAQAAQQDREPDFSFLEA